MLLPSADALPIGVVVGGGADDDEISEEDGGDVAVVGNDAVVDVAVPVLADGVWSEDISRKAVFFTTSE